MSPEEFVVFLIITLDGALMDINVHFLAESGLALSLKQQI